jgi:hypothetical protein
VRFKLAAQLVKAAASHRRAGLLLAEAEVAKLLATGRGRSNLVERGTQLLAGIKDQQHPMLAELLGQLLAEAAVEFVGGFCCHRLSAPTSLSVVIGTRSAGF